MGKDRKLRPLIRGLAIVALAMGVGCGASAPPDGWGPIELKPDIGPDVDTTLFVDEMTRIDSTTDCVKLRAVFPHGYEGETAIFGLEKEGIGNNYGDDPVFSRSCDPDDGATTEAKIDATGVAELKATWLTEECDHKPSHEFHPADSFRFKATVNSTVARSPTVVFWKRVHFEADYFVNVCWDEIAPPWDQSVTEHLFLSYTVAGTYTAESETTCYAMIRDSAEIRDGLLNPNYYSWYPLPNVIDNSSDFYNACEDLLNEPYLRDAPLPIVYTFFADYSTGCNPHPERGYVRGVTVYSSGGSPMLIMIFADAIRDEFDPPDAAEYKILTGIFLAHELGHYLTGYALDHENIDGHNLKCIMDGSADAWVSNPALYPNAFLCRECADSLKSYHNAFFEPPLGFGPYKTLKEEQR